MNPKGHKGRGSVGRVFRYERKLKENPEFAKKVKEYQERRKRKWKRKKTSLYFFLN